jgi:hypothetical protein
VTHAGSVVSSFGGGTGFLLGSALIMEDTVWGRSMGDRGGLSRATEVMLSSAMTTESRRIVFLLGFGRRKLRRDVINREDKLVGVKFRRSKRAMGLLIVVCQVN